MEQKTLARWLKWIVIGIGLCGVAIYALVIPYAAEELAGLYPQFSHAVLPWKIFLWCSGVPCFAVLFFAWDIASGIGHDRSFSMENARNLKWIAGLAIGDALFFFLGNVLFLFLGINRPGILLASCVVMFIGVAVAVAAAALSHLVKKAADLQEQSDLTI